MVLIIAWGMWIYQWNLVFTLIIGSPTSFRSHVFFRIFPPILSSLFSINRKVFYLKVQFKLWITLPHNLSFPLAIFWRFQFFWLFEIFAIQIIHFKPQRHLSVDERTCFPIRRAVSMVPTYAAIYVYGLTYYVLKKTCYACSPGETCSWLNFFFTCMS